MSKRFEMPDPRPPHDAFRDVRIQHGGKRWTATWHVADGRLSVDSVLGSTSERIDADANPATRAAELLHAMVAGRRRGFDDPVGF